MTVRVVELWASNDKKHWVLIGEFPLGYSPILPYLSYKHYKAIQKTKLEKEHEGKD